MATLDGEEVTLVPDDEYVYVDVEGHKRIARDGHYKNNGEWQWHYYSAVHSADCRCITDPEGWY